LNSARIPDREAARRTAKPPALVHTLVFMDQEAQTQVIEDQLDALQSMPINDEPTARAAYVHAMTAVSRINLFSAEAKARAIMGAGGPVDAILGRLKNWLDRLVTAMTQIVANFAKATSFSVSMGTELSVTVSFQV
jgi:hypothetical protein